MSLLKFILTDEHIKLVKHLKINSKEFDSDGVGPLISSSEPFGGDNTFEEMFLILYGRPEDIEELPNPWDEESAVPWTDEQREEMERLLLELPIALDIILFMGESKPGKYKSPTYVRDWKLA